MPVEAPVIRAVPLDECVDMVLNLLNLRGVLPRTQIE
jgi:hypothetical protein